MSRLLCILIVFLIAQGVAAQIIEADVEADADDAPEPSMVPMVRVGKVLGAQGDSIPYVEYNAAYIYPEPVFKNEKQRQKYNKLVRNVKKVLPIAKEARMIMIETYEYLETLPDEKSRKEHLKRVEKNIMEEYSPRMKKLTYAQGKLLIKLINRECSSSGYDIINAFLGPVRAGFYQVFAWTFGASLKKEYDAEGVDRITERVVRQVEAGQI